MIIQILLEFLKSLFKGRETTPVVEVFISEADYFKIETLYPPIQPLAMELIQEARKAGLHVSIFEAIRGFDRQAGLYAIGRTKDLDKDPITYVQTSWHNFGMAIDVVFNKDGWSWSKDNNWGKLREIARKIGWHTVGEWDKAHFEITYDQKINFLRGIYDRNKDMNDVWEYLDTLSLA